MRSEIGVDGTNSFEKAHHDIFDLCFLGLSGQLLFFGEGMGKISPDRVDLLLRHILTQSCFHEESTSQLDHVSLGRSDSVECLVVAMHFGHCLLNKGDKGVPQIRGG